MPCGLPLSSSPRLRSPHTERALSVLALALLIPSCLYGETRRVDAKIGINELRISAPKDADVSWEARQPIDLEYIEHQLQSGSSAIVFCVSSSQQIVIVSDVIDWEKRKREKTTWIISVSGDDEGDQDEGEDDQDDGPSPPSPDPPDNVPNKYGIGPAIYPPLSKIQDTSQLQAFIGFLQQHESLLNSSRITGRQALANAEAQLEKWPVWIDVRAAFSKSIQDAARQYGSGMTDVKNYFREARLTAELFR